MLVRSNSDTDFFKDKKFIENINNKIQKVDDLSKSKKQMKKSSYNLGSVRETIKLNRKLTDYELRKVNENECNISIKKNSTFCLNNSVELSGNKQIKIFLEKFWQIHADTDLYFKYNILKDLKSNVRNKIYFKNIN
jgi:hypothetical protein